MRRVRLEGQLETVTRRERERERKRKSKWERGDVRG